ncbi:MBL fold metallo-hydrolase [Porticoccus litoralis]|uniref:MBL fold metallo-hydrolase n=1 Tax=Porticoccus litoralis TaxID=434086 RepID=A0AAW8B444_9GAMM|nr:MBL fold metallo-hydrolase [Porticoccus litoralis]MDP1520741.1 MBL fold metallo-hydrolase [Porticoccus litoralis]
MSRVLKTFVLAAVVSCGNMALAGHHWENINFETTRVGENLYALIAEGGNLGVSIGEDGTFLIDDQFAPLTRKLLWQIGELGGGTPRFLVNTHWHFDHTGGNENLGAEGTLIIAHDNVRKLLSRDNHISAFNRDVPALSSEGLPMITFSHDTTFHLNQETIHVFHVANAHTDGDAVVHFQQSNVIHAGDIWFNGFYPFIDVEHGGSLAGVIAATEQIIALSDAQTKIIPGHGPVGNRAELMAYRDMLVGVFNTLSALQAEGKSLQEVIAMHPIKSYEAEWGDEFLTTEQWLGIIYSGLGN